MCKGWKEQKSGRNHCIVRHVSLFKQLSWSPVKEMGGKLTSENKKGPIDTIDRDILLKFSGYRKLDEFSGTGKTEIKKVIQR